MLMYQKSMLVIIAEGNVLTSDNVENVSKRSFSLVFRMAPILACRRRFDNAAYTNIHKHKRHSDVAKITFEQCVFYVMTSTFVTATESYTQSLVSMYYDHVNCLVNTWGFLR